MAHLLTIWLVIIGGFASAQDVTCADTYDENYSQAYSAWNDAAYDSALALFNCAIELEPEAVNALHMRGLTYEKMEQWEEALESYLVVVDIDPTYGISQLGAGNAYLTLDDYENAALYISNFIELDETNAFAFYNRSLAYSGLEDYESALADIDQAIELDRAFAWAYGARATVHNNLEDYEAALDDLIVAIALEPDGQAWFYSVRGFAYAGLGAYEQAKAAYDHYVEITEPATRDPDVMADIQRLDEILAGRCTLMPIVEGNVNRRHQPDIDSAVVGVIAVGESVLADLRRVDPEGMIWWRLAELDGWVREDTVSESAGCVQLVGS